jgi:LDH2 family malate/lactate/ureidoglycolate dehydrogenase
MAYAPAALERWTARVFEACAMPAADAGRAAALLVRSELRGYRTHGMTRVPSYVDRLEAGDFNPLPAMRHESFPGGIVLEADGAIGQVAVPRDRVGHRRAQAFGLGAGRGTRCGHLSALGIHALMAAEAGFLPARAADAAAVRSRFRPAIGLLDRVQPQCRGPRRSCSTSRGVARAATFSCRTGGKPIPAGGPWTGRRPPPMRSALNGALLPMGGHKGIGIAMLVECLAAAVAANTASLDPSHNVVRSRVRWGGGVGSSGWSGPARSAVADHFGAYMSAGPAPTSTRATAGKLPGSRGGRLEQGTRARHPGFSAIAS